VNPMSDELFSVLEYLVNHPQTPYKSIYSLFGNNSHLVLQLKNLKYVSIKQENPNLWYLLPQDQRKDYFIFLTSKGLEAYRLEKKKREQDSRSKTQEKPIDTHQNNLSRGDIIGIAGVVVSAIGIIVSILIEVLH